VGVVVSMALSCSRRRMEAVDEISLALILDLVTRF